MNYRYQESGAISTLKEIVKGESILPRKFMIGIDVGGTFTDGVAVDETGKVYIAKSSSTKGDPTIGVLNTLRKLAEQSGERIETFVPQVGRFVYGTTVATNALLERQGREIALITTKGFKDQLNLRRIRRDNGYDLRAAHPEPFVSRHHTYEVTERVDFKGNVLMPLVEKDVMATARKIEQAGIASVAVCLLFSFLNPEHERKVREILYRELPGIQVSISSDVCPEIREYERTSTVAINAYLTQTVQSHLEKLEKALADLGLTAKLQIMQSSGGVTASKMITDRPVNIFLSGPAGGVVASSYIGALDSKKEKPNIIAVDMGGTSFDMTLLTGCEIPLSVRSVIHGWDIIVPTIDIQTIGSGGGSIAWIDAGNGLHVGPQSAGSTPGPVSYMQGGEQPTVTDADLVMGYIDPNYFLGGEMILNKEKAEEAIEKLADQLGLNMVEVASGIYSIVNECMLGGLRVATLQRGHDPRDYTLFVFGGAASIHVPDFAAELGIHHIIIPRDASVFSAEGLTISEIRFDYTKNISRNTAELTIEELMEHYQELIAKGNQDLAETDIPEEDRYYCLRADMKYPGEFSEFIIDISDCTHSIQEAVDCFAEYHKAQYGYAEDEMPDIVNIRVSAFGRMRKPKFARMGSQGKDSGHAWKKTRNAYFHELNGMIETNVYDGTRMISGNQVSGPAIIELPTTTIVIRPEQFCFVDEYSNFNIICNTEDRNDE